MENRLLELFRREVARQARFALMSFSDLEKALERNEVDRIWCAVQGFLVGAANVSKLLWGSGRSKSNGRKALRQSLGVPDESPLASRTMRNHFEHFDERLESWAKSSKTKNIIDSNIMSGRAISGFDSCAYLRNLDPKKWKLTFINETHDLAPVLEALRDLGGNEPAIAGS